MGCGFLLAGVRAVGAAGRGLGSLYAGSAGRRWCVRVGIRCSPPAVSCDPVARGVRGRALSLLRLPSSTGLQGPAVHVLSARVCRYGAQHCPRGLYALRGASAVRRRPSPSCPSSGAGSQGSATRMPQVRSVRAWGPGTVPTARALASWRGAL